jgi:hypothetical protein
MENSSRPHPTLGISPQALEATLGTSAARQGRAPHLLVKSCWIRGKPPPGPPRRMVTKIQVRPTVMTRATMRKGPGGRTDMGQAHLRQQ